MHAWDETKATGDDCISTYIIKRIAANIDVPFTHLCRRLFSEACWPTRWQMHLLCPIYKKLSVYMAANYRGIHITSVLSKVAEHVIGDPLVAFLQDRGFGKNQWAFTKGRSCRDLVTMLTMCWILEIGKGNIIDAYLSDTSAAFDRVFKDYLMGRLQAAGVGPLYLNFVDSYLQPRSAQVVVEGAASDLLK